MTPSQDFQRKAIKAADEDFLQSLADYLAQFSEGNVPTVPFFNKADGSIDREKTLALPDYEGFKEKP